MALRPVTDRVRRRLRRRMDHPARRPRLRGPPPGPGRQPAADLQRPTVPDRRGAPAARPAAGPPHVSRRPGAAVMISFVVPAYNEEQLLGQTLRAINAAAAALTEPCEVIVAD